MNFLGKINQFLFPGAKEYPKVGAGKMVVLGFQHAFAMSCATILVPLLTGLDVGVALFAAGLGTLIFHLCTGGRMPTFLGSSFAFIASLQLVIGSYGTKEEGIPYAMGGILCAGLFYVLLSLLIRLFGSRFMDRLFPPVVRGVGIAIIGLNLASSAVANIQGNGIEQFTPAYYWSWGIALVVCVTAHCAVQLRQGYGEDVLHRYFPGSGICADASSGEDRRRSGGIDEFGRHSGPYMV